MKRENWPLARPRHSHNHIVGLQSSARQGCPVCAMLLNGLSPSTTKTLLESWSQSQSLVTIGYKFPQGTYHIQLTFPLRDDQGTTVHVNAAGK